MLLKLGILPTARVGCASAILLVLDLFEIWFIISRSKSCQYNFQWLAAFICSYLLTLALFASFNSLSLCFLFNSISPLDSLSGKLTFCLNLFISPSILHFHLDSFFFVCSAFYNQFYPLCQSYAYSPTQTRYITSFRTKKKYVNNLQQQLIS